MNSPKQIEHERYNDAIRIDLMRFEKYRSIGQMANVIERGRTADRKGTRLLLFDLIRRDFDWASTFNAFAIAST